MVKLSPSLAAAAVSIAAAIAQPAVLSERPAPHIRPNDLKADVSFLASDALEGRGTPSRGLNIAAEYISSQFRRVGLEPAGDDGYFQTATLLQITPNTDGLEFRLGGLSAARKSITIQDPVAAELKGAAAFKANVADVERLPPATVKGKVLVIDAAEAGFQAQRRLSVALARLEPALVVLVRGDFASGNRPARIPLRETAPKIPILSVTDPAIRDAVADAASGPLEGAVTARIPAPQTETVKLRNVVGVIRGSDPALQDTYLVVTAHYDHLGINPNLQGDQIFNGANDDASGTASLIEIAGSLSSLETKPRRTIVFVAVFGEEVGGLGARWYTGHPVFPLGRTIADINLEQLGRTDDSEGPKPRQFNLTGFDYTDIAATMASAGAASGIRVVKHEKNSDAFFGRSDNITFAEAGIPSTTLSVSYVFPDYHKPGDEWQKLDYDNMAKVDAAVALGVWSIANNTKAPEWNVDNPKAARYIHR
jgi:hypothetical protein